MIAERLSVTSAAEAQFAEDVRAGLERSGQKQLPSKYLYDPVGSALFEAISVMPEYGLTRADERILRRHSRNIAHLLPESLCVAELGSGSGKKTRHLLEAFSADRSHLTYYPIEISRAALASCERQLADINGVTLQCVEREYLDGLRQVSNSRHAGEHMLVLFLGSTIGNFDSGEDAQFLRSVRETLLAGDFLLLGTDLVKPTNLLLAAYDDPTGVTAAFNLNLLSRINRELSADFDLRSFEHVARFNQETSSVEMHLRSKQRQNVAVERAEFTARFSEGETIWTESSHKYLAQEVETLASASGFHCLAQWIDSEWWFAENLLVAG